MDEMDESVEGGGELLDWLVESGMAAGSATLVPLTGGVSSDIHLVDDGGRQFVVKRALARLKVEAEWLADTSRNAWEQEFMRYVAGFRPDAVPEILYSDPGRGFFCMEFLDGFRVWKAALMEGECDFGLARRSGGLIGEVHARSLGDVEVARRFDTAGNFDQLRVDPYLRAAAAAHPGVAAPILEEAERLLGASECLVHGDYSPKNLLFRDGRLVVLDCEVAWYGDPAFDLSFLLNHLLLKALHHSPSPPPFDGMVDAARQGYREAMGGLVGDVELRVARLLPMLALARVDGKSPVEYLGEAKRETVRRLATEMIRCPPRSLDAMIAAWFEGLEQ